MRAFLQRSKNIIESKYFIAVLSFVSLISFFTDVSYIALYTACLTVIIAVISKADLRCILGIFLLGLASHRHVNTNINAGFIIFIILSLLMFISIIYFIVINHKEVWRKIKKDFVLWSLILIILSMALSLINAPVMKDSLIGFGYFIGIVITYFVSRIMIERTEEVKEIISYSFVIIGITLAIEIFGNILFTYLEGFNVKEMIKIKALNVGMFNQNHIIAAINISFIMSVYYFIINKKIFARILFLINALLFIATNLMLSCRGGFVGLFVSFILIGIAYVIYYKKNPNSGLSNDIPYIISGIAGFVIVLLILIFTGYIKNAFDRFNDAEAIFGKRDDVFKIAWQQFLKHPIIGSGVYSSHYYLIDIDRVNRIWHYHNHILQMLGTCGIIGAISFIIYLVFSVKRTINCNLFSMIAFILTIYFLVHGSLDTLYFNKSLMPLLLIVIAVIDEKEKINQEELIDLNSN